MIATMLVQYQDVEINQEEINSQKKLNDGKILTYTADLGKSKGAKCYLDGQSRCLIRQSVTVVENSTPEWKQAVLKQEQGYRTRAKKENKWAFLGTTI